MTAKEIEQALQTAWMADERVAELFGFEAGAAFDAVYGKVSVVRLLLWVVAQVEAAYGTELERWEQEVAAVGAETQYGSESWWRLWATQWQRGDALQVEDGKLRYAEEDASKRVVNYVSMSVAGRLLQLKVAKSAAGGVPTPLTEAELTEYRAYIGRVKPLGIQVRVVSKAADEVAIGATVRYDGELKPSEVRTAVLAAAQRYVQGLDFGGVMYRGALTAAMVAVDGVRDVALRSLTVGGVEVADKVELESGYATVTMGTVEMEAV